MCEQPRTVEEFRTWARSGSPLPLPGAGNTAERFRLLRQSAAADASLGRLVEAHGDALAILNDAHVGHGQPAALAVWASGATSDVVLHQLQRGYAVNGTRKFCGGAPIVDAAIVTTHGPEGEQLVLIDLHLPGVQIDTSTWKTRAFTDAGISTVRFDDVRINDEDLVGPPQWYSQRPGFWFGAVGVAALWAGMADSVLSMLPELKRHDDQLSDAAEGRAIAAMWAVSALLDKAAQEMDRKHGGHLGHTGHSGNTGHTSSSAQALGLACRQCVRSEIESALVAFDQEVGPAATALNPQLAVKRLELSLALAQSHGARDLAVLGRGGAVAFTVM